MREFFLIDVFTKEILQGNPLALVPDANGLDEETLRAIAREMNQSETTFLVPPTLQGADYRLRAFTAAGHEVGGAGHFAIGTWWWLAETGKLTLRLGSNRFVQQIGQVLLPVELTVVDGRVQAVTLFQSEPRFGKTHEDLPALAKSLGLPPSDIAAESLPAQVVSTGAGHLMVPVRSAEALERISPSADFLLAQLRSVEAEGCYAFCSEPRLTAPPTYRARFFNPGYGLWEDPATATAAGPLVCHLVAHGKVAAGAKVHVEQGHALRRPSVLEVAYDGDRVTVSGGAVVVARGELTV